MYQQLSHEEVEQLIQGREDVVIADARDRESFHESHIKNAVHLSMPTLQEYCDAAQKKHPIVVYCYHGITSQSVAQHLVDQGFSEVYSLVGGFETWKEHHPTSISNAGE